jgi:hypothetical protein
VRRFGYARQGEVGRAADETEIEDRRRYSAPQEIKAIVGVLEGWWRPLLLTVIFTDLRASELRGLRWQDVDPAQLSEPSPFRLSSFVRVGRGVDLQM